MSKEMKFEEKLVRLGQIVSELEGGELSLEKSIALYEEGNKLSQELNEELKSAKLKIEKISAK